MSVIIRDRERFDIQTHRGEGDMKTEERDLKVLFLKIGVMGPQAKECWQPPEAGRGKKIRVSPRAS